jgi:hypothetical protein
MAAMAIPHTTRAGRGDCRMCRSGQVAEQEQQRTVHRGEDHVGHQHAPEHADALAAIELSQAVQSLGAIPRPHVYLWFTAREEAQRQLGATRIRRGDRA